MKPTAVEYLKTFAVQTPSEISDMSGVLRRFLDDKGFSPRIAVQLAKAQIFGLALRKLVLRDENSTDGSLFDYMGSVMVNAKAAATPSQYKGLAVQNNAIDRALAGAAHRNPNGHVHGEGATTIFNPTHLRDLIYNRPRKFLNTPIAIIGNGAAGIFTHFALSRMGFDNITIHEKAKSSLGIWNQKNVYGGTKNNPRALRFFDRLLDAAPGPGTDIRDFLSNIDIGSAREGSGVTSVIPGNLNHTVNSDYYGVRNYPIVINAIGLGKPQKLSDPTRMTTSTPATLAGPRWQQQLTKADVRGKRFVFIGLGNSTAEMVRQIHDFIDQGVDVDYRIVTHYPEDAVWNPRSYVEKDGRMYRVFRDLSKLNLVDFQGDLPDSLKDYQRALYGKKILYGVKRWEISGDKLVVFNASGKPMTEVGCDKLFTLTGYKHTKESITQMGCKYDPDGNCALYDYDGEFIADPLASGGNRLFKGYFGFGSILESPQNPNAIVFPGMFHRLGDLLFGVLMRAAEYTDNQT